jgi:hypothetical protein
VSLVAPFVFDGGRLFDVSVITVRSLDMDPRAYSALTVLIKVR